MVRKKYNHQAHYRDPIYQTSHTDGYIKIKIHHLKFKILTHLKYKQKNFTQIVIHTQTNLLLNLKQKSSQIPLETL